MNGRAAAPPAQSAPVAIRIMAGSVRVAGETVAMADLADALARLKASGVTALKTVNVLEDDEIRQGIKEYANWPTIPQLYIDGEFIGGSDIMMEMYQSGELQQLISK